MDGRNKGTPKSVILFCAAAVDVDSGVRSLVFAVAQESSSDCGFWGYEQCVDISILSPFIRAVATVDDDFSDLTLFRSLRTRHTHNAHEWMWHVSFTHLIRFHFTGVFLYAPSCVRTNLYFLHRNQNRHYYIHFYPLHLGHDGCANSARRTRATRKEPNKMRCFALIYCIGNVLFYVLRISATPLLRSTSSFIVSLPFWPPLSTPSSRTLWDEWDTRDDKYVCEFKRCKSYACWISMMVRETEQANGQTRTPESKIIEK